jgi:drug/metabolite transporter (DMT)-like permease
MKDEKKAYFYASLVVLLWSTVASAFKITLRYLDFYQLLLGATLVSFGFFLLASLFQKKAPLLKRLTKRDYLRSFGLGFLNPFIYYAVLFKAYSLLPAQAAQPLNQTWVIILSILSIFFLKQKVGLRSILALFVSFFGVLVISTEGRIRELKFSNPLGVSLALGSAIIWSLFWIYNLKDPREDLVKMCGNFFFGLLLIITFLLFFGKLGESLVRLMNTREGLIGAIYVGLFEMGITFLLWLKALQLSENTARISNLIYLIPFLSLIVIRLTVGERIFLSTITGLGFIILGIMLQRR